MIITNTLKKSSFCEELPFSHFSIEARKPLSPCREAQVIYKFLWQKKRKVKILYDFRMPRKRDKQEELDLKHFRPFPTPPSTMKEEGAMYISYF